MRRSSSVIGTNAVVSVPRIPQPLPIGGCDSQLIRWIDGTYDMVAVQEQSKYKRTSGVDFGPVDVVKYADAFGAIGLTIETPDQIGSTLKKAFEIPGPALIGIRVDYRDNHKLFEKVHEHLLN